MGIISPEYVNLRRFKSLNGFYFAVATFLSNVPSTVIASFHVWKWYIQGPISTLPAVEMLCALRPDGQLKDAKDIEWYNDRDDDSPMLPSPPPATSNGKITAFVSRRSGRAIKLTEKIRETVNSAPAKRPAPAAPEGRPAPKRIQTGSHLNRHGDDDDAEPPAAEELSDEEEEEDKEEAYERTKALGDEDRKYRKQMKKDERSADLKTIFT
ncbi:hypothetical protein EV424DRAFT_1350246 [Suillus variegatus]|nr:hypothetical protein EV424DRAFT_1350246 [Suillus variegatus]